MGGSGRVIQPKTESTCSASYFNADKIAAHELVSLRKAQKLVGLSQCSSKDELDNKISEFLIEINKLDNLSPDINNTRQDLLTVHEYLKFRYNSFFSFEGVELAECPSDEYKVDGELDQMGLLDCLLAKPLNNSSQLISAWDREHTLVFLFLYLSEKYQLGAMDTENIYEHWRETYGHFVIDEGCYRRQTCSFSILSYALELQMLYLDYVYGAEDTWSDSIELLTKEKYFRELYLSSEFSEYYPEIYSTLNTEILKYWSD